MMVNHVGGSSCGVMSKKSTGHIELRLLLLLLLWLTSEAGGTLCMVHLYSHDALESLNARHEIHMSSIEVSGLLLLLWRRSWLLLPRLNFI